MSSRHLCRQKIAPITRIEIRRSNICDAEMTIMNTPFSIFSWFLLILRKEEYYASEKTNGSVCKYVKNATNFQYINAEIYIQQNKNIFAFIYSISVGAPKAALERESNTNEI